MVKADGKTAKGCVYFYYYPAYKELAEFKGEDRWPWKIGHSKNIDPEDRIRDQVTGMPEEPEIEIIIYTVSPELLEKLIHSNLKARNVHIQNAPGNEWFLIDDVIAREIQRAYGEFEYSFDA